MPRYFLEIAYDGKPYRGWQRQPSDPSVQETLELALRKVLRLPELYVVGCGRTDTGVHASTYFLHFEAPTDRVIDDRFAFRISSMLPESIAVLRTISVPDDAHARFSATERGYKYLINRRKDPFLAGRSYLLYPALDVDAMNEACECLIGKQDFSSFCKAGADNKTMLCDVRHARWELTDQGYQFRITSDRFLRNMVRACVGTCIRIGKGDAPASSMKEVLAAKARSAAGKSAPARGLYLDHVAYPFILQEDRNKQAVFSR